MKGGKAGVLSGDGMTCPKCGRIMGRFVHPVGWAPPPGRGYFIYWDRCIPCGHIQHYGEAKRQA